MKKNKKFVQDSCAGVQKGGYNVAVEDSLGRSDSMARDFGFFIENLDRLYAEYGGKFLAIKNQTILGAYDTFLEAIEKTSVSERFGTFLIQQCVPNVDQMTAHFAGNVTV